MIHMKKQPIIIVLVLVLSLCFCSCHTRGDGERQETVEEKGVESLTGTEETAAEPGSAPDTTMMREVRAKLPAATL